MRVRLLKNYAPPGEGRPRFSGELLTVPDERACEMIAQRMAVAFEDPPEQHPDVLPSDADSDQHE